MTVADAVGLAIYLLKFACYSLAGLCIGNGIYIFVYYLRQSWPTLATGMTVLLVSTTYILLSVRGIESLFDWVSRTVVTPEGGLNTSLAGLVVIGMVVPGTVTAGVALLVCVRRVAETVHARIATGKNMLS